MLSEVLGQCIEVPSETVGDRRSGQRSEECAGFLCSPVVATTLVRPFCGVVGVSADDIRVCDVLVSENSRDVILRFAQQITLAF